MNGKRPPPTTEQLQERMEALELLMQALVVVLECEPRFSAAKLHAWLDICNQRMRSTGSATQSTLAALERLQREVLQ